MLLVAHELSNRKKHETGRDDQQRDAERHARQHPQISNQRKRFEVIDDGTGADADCREQRWWSNDGGAVSHDAHVMSADHVIRRVHS